MPMKHNDPPPLLTVPQVAKRLGLGTDAVTDLIVAGELRAVNIGAGKVRRKLRIAQEWLEDFLQRREVKPPAPPPPRRRRTPKSDVYEYFT